MKPREVRAHFDAFLGNIPAHLDAFSVLVEDTGGPTLDLTPDSLVALWSWYTARARLRATASRDEELGTARDPKSMLWFDLKTRFTAETECDIISVAVYVGEVMRIQDPSIHWEVPMQPPRNYNLHQPTLVGFKDGSTINPFRTIPVLTLKYFSGDTDPHLLRRLYRIWTEGPGDFMPQFVKERLRGK